MTRKLWPEQHFNERESGPRMNFWRDTNCLLLTSTMVGVFLGCGVLYCIHYSGNTEEVICIFMEYLVFTFVAKLLTTDFAQLAESRV